MRDITISLNEIKAFSPCTIAWKHCKRVLRAQGLSIKTDGDSQFLLLTVAGWLRDDPQEWPEDFDWLLECISDMGDMEMLPESLSRFKDRYPDTARAKAVRKLRNSLLPFMHEYRHAGADSIEEANAAAKLLTQINRRIGKVHFHMLRVR